MKGLSRGVPVLPSAWAADVKKEAAAHASASTSTRRIGVPVGVIAGCVADYVILT
jgi:hypothetical protein